MQYLFDKIGNCFGSTFLLVAYLILVPSEESNHDTVYIRYVYGITEAEYWCSALMGVIAIVLPYITFIYCYKYILLSHRPTLDTCCLCAVFKPTLLEQK